MSTLVRLSIVICICAIAPAFARGPAPTAEPEQPASQSSAPAAPNAASQPAAAASSATTNAASTTPATAEKPSTTQSPNATAEASSSGGASKVVLVDKTLTDAQVKQLLAKGYRPQSRSGEVLYCRREAVLGSRFEQKICKTGERIMRDEVDSKEEADRMQRATGNNPMGK